MTSFSPTGVLLVNLGSPDAPTPAALRRYLAEFLSDRRVVDWPRWVWLPILHGIILRTRPRKSAALYARVWTEAGSPLIDISRRQAAALAERLGDDHRVALAMRYGNPSLARGLDELRGAGCDRVVVLPMFPQECVATTGSVVAAVEDCRARKEWPPEFRVVPAFPTDEGYLGACAASVRETLDRHRDVDHVVFSFHGIPERVVARGDPYRTHCESTAAALAHRLELGDDDWTLVYQSRFGPETWLRPYASEAVPALAATKRKVLVACPGFTADCLETIDEIGHELRKDFVAAGGKDLVLAPCVNDRPEFVDALADLVAREAR